MRLDVLSRNEAIKVRGRVVFWVTLSILFALLVIEFGGAYRAYINDTTPGAAAFVFPGAWLTILSPLMVHVTIYFGASLVLLLVANEFAWRTARQNVIDGLSKEELFASKLLLIPFVLVLFLTIHVVTGVGFATAAMIHGPAQAVAPTTPAGLLGAGAATFDSTAQGKGGGSRAPTMDAPEAALLGGTVLAFIGYSSMALFIAFALRNPGSSLGIWLLYSLGFEPLLAVALVRVNDNLRSVVKFFPIKTFGYLTNYVEFNPDLYRRAAEQAGRLRAFGGHTPDPDVFGHGLVLTALAWIAIFLGGSFYWFRKRDL